MLETLPPSLFLSVCLSGCLLRLIQMREPRRNAVKQLLAYESEGKRREDECSLSETVTSAFKEVKSECLFPTQHPVVLVNPGIRNISPSFAEQCKSVYMHNAISGECSRTESLLILIHRVYQIACQFVQFAIAAISIRRGLRMDCPYSSCGEQLKIRNVDIFLCSV